MLEADTTKGEKRSARTSGDGMEQEALSNNENKAVPCITKVKLEYQSNFKSDRKNASLNINAPIIQENVCQHELTNSLISENISKRKLQYLIPRIVSPAICSKSKNNRKPKFVPFEPYKCAIKPIIPSKIPLKIRKNKNNLDISILVTQMSNMKTSELITAAPEKDRMGNESEFTKEHERLLKEIKNLKKERDYVQSQLKFQVQVNTELKNLLVAAVGEDMQARVNVLTEDKLQLARALLDTANNLSTHTEQIEFLAGQCEVWRSKFLSSSVMVEELARWKADLSHKNALLSISNKNMLQLAAQVREMEIHILKNLKFLSKLKQLNLPSSDLVTLTSECLNITQQMVLHCGIGMPDNVIFQNLEMLTEAEKEAINALQCISQPLISTDEAFKAIVDKAFSSNLKDKLT